MFNHKNWQLLQLFAGEGAAGSGASAGDGSGAAAAAGEGSADAGHQRLRELGVPESKIRKQKSNAPSSLPGGSYRTQVQRQIPERPGGAVNLERSNAQREEAPPRMSWEEIKSDPEYNREIQKIIQARVRDQGQNKAILETLTPALKHLAREKGLDPENLDYTALARTITGDYEKKAAQMGTTVEAVRMLDQQQRSIQQLRFQSHIQNLEIQGQALKAVFPGFDLRAEMRNPTFVRLTSPSVGFSVEDAFHAVHRREIQAQSMQVAAQKTQELISNAIRSGTHRPDETGVSAQAPSVSRFDYRNATPAQRQALKNEIRRAAAEGRKLYPG